MINTKAKRTTGITALETENALVSRECAIEGIVLLKNNGALPLKSNRVALYGAGA